MELGQELRGGDAGGDQCERRAVPGEERALVGVRETGVGFDFGGGRVVAHSGEYQGQTTEIGHPKGRSRHWAAMANVLGDLPADRERSVHAPARTSSMRRGLLPLGLDMDARCGDGEASLTEWQIDGENPP